VLILEYNKGEGRSVEKSSASSSDMSVGGAMVNSVTSSEMSETLYATSNCTQTA
jgi:hypothetical protein